jgi:chemotaxis protein MotC
MKWKRPTKRLSAVVGLGILFGIVCIGAVAHFSGLVQVPSILGSELSPDVDGSAKEAVAAQEYGDKAGQSMQPIPERLSSTGGTEDGVHQSAFALEVRKLLVSQTSAAKGAGQAARSQKQIIARIHTLLSTMDPTLASRQDHEALAIYLLSGGSPRGTAKLIASALPNSTHLKLMEGAKAYVVGDLERAKEVLLKLDATDFQSQLQGRLLLTQAALSNSYDHVAQKQMLEKSAGLLPGTLVEEAARRRLINLSVSAADAPAFSRHTSHYVRRFPKSLYIADFAIVFQKGVLQFEAMGRPVSRHLVKSAVSVLPSELRRDVILSISREAATSGLRALCLFAGQDLYKEQAETGSVDNRMLLYATVCDVVEQPERVLETLAGLQTSAFDAEDEQLRSNAVRMAEALIGVSPIAQETDFQGPVLPDPETAALMVRATQQLQSSSDVIREAQ